MSINDSPKAINHILSPTDLSPNSQKALGFAARLAEDLSAQLTACHVQRAQWFSPSIDLDENDTAIEEQMRRPILKCSNDSESTLKWRAAVIDNSFDPARDILNLARETAVDLIVMKARPGVMSAFRFGSIVERVVAAAPCPVLLFPTRFLQNREPSGERLNFQRILFDYDFSQATDELYRLVRSMSERLSAELHILSVLEPPVEITPEFASVGDSRAVLKRAVAEKLDHVLSAGAPAIIPIQKTVEWGEHAQTVLRYADGQHVDLICTTLARPHFSFEKLYCVYLGQLLKSAKCPILVKQSV